MAGLSPSMEVAASGPDAAVRNRIGLCSDSPELTNGPGNRGSRGGCAWCREWDKACPNVSNFVLAFETHGHSSAFNIFCGVASIDPPMEALFLLDSIALTQMDSGFGASMKSFLLEQVN